MISDPMKPLCNDFGDRPGCLREADERYTMRFDDIGEPPIFWCAFCGPEAHALGASLDSALRARGPEFQKELAGLIEHQMSQVVKQ
jgi:hypothetical protein